MLGGHVIKSWSTNQAVIALSSGEAEYYGIVKAASVAIGARSLAADLGVEFQQSIAIMSDASAAIGINNRSGVEKIRHIEVTQLCVQEKVANGEMVIHKVTIESNLADALTKAVDARTIETHVIGINAERLCDRHPLCPSLSDQEEEHAEEGVEGVGGGEIAGAREE